MNNSLLEKVFPALNAAFGGMSQWGPEELGIALAGHVNNCYKPFPMALDAIEKVVTEDFLDLQDEGDVDSFKSTAKKSLIKTLWYENFKEFANKASSTDGWDDFHESNYIAQKAIQDMTAWLTMPCMTYGLTYENAYNIATEGLQKIWNE